MLDAADQELSVFSKDVENAGKLAMETVKATLTKVASELCKNKVGIDLVEIASDVLEKMIIEKKKKSIRENKNGYTGDCIS